MNQLIFPTPFGPFQVKGKHMLLAAIAGMSVGALTLYQLQKRTGKFIPGNRL